MTLKKEFVLRRICEDSFLVPVGKTAIEKNGLFLLNEVALRIWELLPAAKTEEEIVDALETEYEAPREQLAADTAELLSKLRDMDILE